MKSAGTGTLTTIASIVGLVGLGVGGYNMMTTGCPLGSCSTGSVEAAAGVMSTSAGAHEGECSSSCSHGAKAAACDSAKGASAAGECSGQKACDHEHAEGASTEDKAKDAKPEVDPATQADSGTSSEASPS